MLQGWGFYKYNPWKPRFDKVTRMLIEAGLIDTFMERTMRKMKDIHLHSNEEKVKFEEREQITSLSVDDLYGVFYFTMFGLFAGFCCFILEFWIKKLLFVKTTATTNVNHIETNEQ